MKEIKIICPECNKETIYKRDNTRFYIGLILIVNFSALVAFIIGYWVR